MLNLENVINKYMVGDNIEIIPNIPDDCLNLIYVDGPFCTNRDFGDFKDRWKDVGDFCTGFMKPRFEQIKPKMCRDSNIIVHSDTSSSHYLKKTLDDVFGIKKFHNEIIWVTNGNSKTKSKLYKSHDVLLVYSKSNKSKFRPIYKPYGEEYFKKNNVKKCPIHKKLYITCAIYNNQPNVIKRPNLRYEWNGHYKQWLVSKERLRFLDKDNRLQYSASGIPRIKRFLDEMDGLPLTDVWTDIPSIQKNEKLDYATQKPIKLIERLIKLYTDENDVVLDYFAGSGTTGRACINLNRNYILIDKNSKGKKLFNKSISCIESKGKGE